MGRDKYLRWRTWDELRRDEKPIAGIINSDVAITSPEVRTEVSSSVSGEVCVVESSEIDKVEVSLVVLVGCTDGVVVDTDGGGGGGWGITSCVEDGWGDCGW